MYVRRNSMLQRLIGIFIIAMGIVFGSYFSIYYSLIDDPMMLLVLSLIIATLFALGVSVLVIHKKERKLKKEKKILVEMLKKTKASQGQNYTGVLEDMRRKRVY